MSDQGFWLKRLLPIARKAIRSLAPPRNPLATKLPLVWLKDLGEVVGRDVCLLVSYDPLGRVPEHALIQARAWSASGFVVVLIVAIDDPKSFVADQNLSFCDAVVLRGNEGYDFAAWASVIDRIPNLASVRLLALSNDSIYGPLRGFDRLLQDVRSHDADFIGLTDSYEIKHHYQSYMLFFKTAAFTSRRFYDFWRQVRTGSREYVIKKYEVQLLDRMKMGGLRCRAIFATDPAAIPHDSPLTRWRDLLDRSFPFVKSSLLRANPYGVDIQDWRSVIAERGYDPDVIEAHVRHRRAVSAGSNTDLQIESTPEK